MSYPILKPNSSWFTPTLGTITRSIITTINIVDSYTPSGTVADFWDASVAQDGGIMCYVEGTVLTIAGNGSGKIETNANSKCLFSDINKKDYFDVLTSISGLNMLDTSNTTNMSFMFSYCIALLNIDVSGFNTSTATDMELMFNNCRAITSINISNFDISNVLYINAMFQRCEALSDINFGIWNTKSVQDISYIFYNCYALTSVDVSNWDTSKVKWMNNAFYGCNNLVKLDTSNWDTSSCTTFAYMFRGCEKLPYVNTSNWNTNKATTFLQMFQNCFVLSNLDVSNWDTSNITDMGFMFYSCNGLTTLALDDWNVSNVTNFDHTFAHCDNLIVNVSKWNVSNKCKYFGAMFRSNANTYLDVSGFDTSGAVSMFSMFEANRNLEKIDGLQNFNTSNCHSFEEMFKECSSLKELDLSSFDTRKADSDTEARSDKNGYKSQCTKNMFIDCTSLEKITLGANFTFAGDGTADVTYYGVLPTPTSGYWCTIDGTQYAPADIPNLTANTYYASTDIVADIIWERDSKKYISLNIMRIYHNMHNADIDVKLDTLKESMFDAEELTSEDIQFLFI